MGVVELRRLYHVGEDVQVLVARIQLLVVTTRRIGGGGRGTLAGLLRCGGRRRRRRGRGRRGRRGGAPLPFLLGEDLFEDLALLGQVVLQVDQLEVLEEELGQRQGEVPEGQVARGVAVAGVEGVL